MGDLCRRLQEVGETGVYRLNCPLEDLRTSASEGGFVVFEADIESSSGKGEVLAELARAIAAPDWFGHNWDALADALGDLSWHQASGYVLLLHGEPASDPVLEDILDATIAFWRSQGKAFWVFIA